MALLNGCLRTNRLINLVATPYLQSFGTQIIINGMVSYEVWQRLSNNMPVYFAYYAGIMLDACGYLLYAFYYASIIGLGLGTRIHGMLENHGKKQDRITLLKFSTVVVYKQTR